MPSPPPLTPTLQSDTVVFTHAKLPSRQAPAPTAPPAAAAAPRAGAWTSEAQRFPRFRDDREPPPPPTFAVDAPLQHLSHPQQLAPPQPPRVAADAAATGNAKRPNLVHLTVRVLKQGERLGFGIRHDTRRQPRVSTLQGNSAAAKSPLRLGDVLLSVNGVDLGGLSFLEVIQHLKAAPQGELVFRVERDLNASPNRVYEYPAGDLETGEELYVGDPPSSYPPPPPSAQVIHSDRAMASDAPAALASASSSSHSQRANVDLSTMEKTHKLAFQSLATELKKEQAEKALLEDKNNALRKRLQTMLIECDEVRVKASTEVTAVKESARRAALQLEKELAAARAQLRLQDRGPSVARTDSIMSELVACRAQLERARRGEADRSAQLSARFNMESRHAEREAHRARDTVAAMIRSQLRQAGKRSANPAPISSSAASSSASGSENTVSVVYEGLRRLAFLKLFGYPHTLDQYASPDFCSLAQIHRSLEHDELVDLFDNSLSHEERAGIFIVVTAPMDVTYDPNTERLSLVCGWTEQNTIRELARNFRF